MKQTKNLFIIDDDEVFVFLTKKMIESANLQVEIFTFGDGEEAIEHLKVIADNHDLLPDIILLDINMPILDGWGFLEEYATLRHTLLKEISLYISSSSISPYDVERAKSNILVSDYLVKPYGENKIKEIVDHAMSKTYTI